MHTLKRITSLVVAVALGVVFALAPFQAAHAEAEGRPWRIGVKADIPSMGHIQDGIRTGFEIDLAKELINRLPPELSDRLKRKGFEFRTVTTQDRFEKLDSGDVDLLIATVSVTPARELRYKFSDPYFYTRIGFVTKRKAPLDSVDALDAKTIGALKNSTTVPTVSQFPGVTLLLRDDLAALQEDLESDRIDAIAEDLTFAIGTLAQLGDEYVRSSFFIGSEAYAIAFRANEAKQIIDGFNDALLSMKRDGTIEETAKKHGLTYLGRAHRLAEERLE